jgi:hypothetical protein
MLGGSVYNIKENTEALVVSSKETGLEITVDNSTYMFVSHYQNTGRNNKEGVIIFPLKAWRFSNNLETDLKNYNSIQEEINSRLKAGNAFNYSVQNLSLQACYPKVQN